MMFLYSSHFKIQTKLSSHKLLKKTFWTCWLFYLTWKPNFLALSSYSWNLSIWNESKSFHVLSGFSKHATQCERDIHDCSKLNIIIQWSCSSGDNHPYFIFLLLVCLNISSILIKPWLLNGIFSWHFKRTILVLHGVI